MQYSYEGNRKKENIEKFVVDTLGNIFTETNIFGENYKMESAVNFLFEVRNQLNAVRGMYVDALMSTIGGVLKVRLTYGGKKFDPQFTSKGTRKFSNRGHAHIRKALESTALLKYKYNYTEGTNNVEAIFNLKDDEFADYQNIIEDTCTYKSSILELDSVEVVIAWANLARVHLGLFRTNEMEQHIIKLRGEVDGFSPNLYDGVVVSFFDEIVHNIYQHSYAQDEKQFKFNIFIYDTTVKISVKVPHSISLENVAHENINSREGTRELVLSINRFD